jgi:hypothetical protein
MIREARDEFDEHLTARSRFKETDKKIRITGYNVRWAYVAIDSNTSAWPAGKEFFPLIGFDRTKG